MGFPWSQAEVRDASCAWIRQASVAAANLANEGGLNQGCQCFRAKSNSNHCVNQGSYLCSQGLWQFLTCLEMHCCGKDWWHMLTHGLCLSCWLDPSSSNPFCMMTLSEDDTPAWKLLSFPGKNISCTKAEQTLWRAQQSQLLSSALALAGTNNTSSPLSYSCGRSLIVFSGWAEQKFKKSVILIPLLIPSPMF